MRLCRFTTLGHPPRHGLLKADLLHVLKAGYPEPGAPVESLLTGEALPLLEVRLLAPVEPGKIVAVGLNYRAHAKEMNKPVPEIPRIFIKPSTSVIGPEDTILLPPQSQQVDHEGELGVVIGRRAWGLTEADALSAVLGYTCVNDVTARDLQVQDGQQYTRAKGFDTFCPLGPWIETELMADNTNVSLTVNGTRRQHGSTADMVFNLPRLLSFITSIMTLMPGDVISTGTPPGVARMVDGDVVEVTVAGIGTLRNPVKARAAP